MAKQKRVSAGKDPMGLAAAALYIACLQNTEKETQKDISEAAGVTEVTVRNRYKDLIKQLHLETPDRKICS
jgi:transcription initiation factor TFIIB